jgi:hypothetical protein
LHVALRVDDDDDDVVVVAVVVTRVGVAFLSLRLRSLYSCSLEETTRTPLEQLCPLRILNRVCPRHKYTLV